MTVITYDIKNTTRKVKNYKQDVEKRYIGSCARLYFFADLVKNLKQSRKKGIKIIIENVGFYEDINN